MTSVLQEMWDGFKRASLFGKALCVLAFVAFWGTIIGLELTTQTNDLNGVLNALFG